MLGSVFDADDAVQETMLRAFRSLGSFEERAALSSWLHRIATNVCLDFLAERRRRSRPIVEAAPGRVGDALTQRPKDAWIEPIADAAVVSADADPHTRAVLKQSTRLAFVAALQELPPKQRAALLLTEVVGFSASDAAATLQMSVPALNSAIQRARAKLDAEAACAADAPADARSLTDGQQKLLQRYVAAFEAYDIDELIKLFHEDATLSMPPYCFWLRGREEIRRWLLGPGEGCRSSRLIATEACGSPAFAQYRPRQGGGHAPWALIVLELDADRVVGMNSFLDAQALFERFGLPAALG
jgi:RNA polymerase sigma-70 factor (ECF subfamily)